MVGGLTTECAACGAGVVSGQRFCAQCGTPQVHVCPSCGAENAPGNRFCPSCGTAVQESDPVTGPDAGPPTVSERRLVSVLFADLVGSTPFAEHRDPEAV